MVNLIDSDDYELRAISKVNDGDGLMTDYVSYLDSAIQYNNLNLFRYDEIEPRDISRCTWNYYFNKAYHHNCGNDF